MFAYWFGTACGQATDRYIHYSDDLLTVDQDVESVELVEDRGDIHVTEARQDIVITLDPDDVDVARGDEKLILNIRPDELTSE